MLGLVPAPAVPHPIPRRPRRTPPTPSGPATRTSASLLPADPRSRSRPPEHARAGEALAVRCQAGPPNRREMTPWPENPTGRSSAVRPPRLRGPLTAIESATGAASVRVPVQQPESQRTQSSRLQCERGLRRLARGCADRCRTAPYAERFSLGRSARERESDPRSVAHGFLRLSNA